MTAGLPGAGVGGLFYLLAALLSPVWEVMRAITAPDSPRRWGLVLRHAALAASVLAAIWVTAWCIGATVMWLSAPAAAGGIDTAQVVAAARQYPAVVSKGLAMFTAATLAMVLLTVEIVRVSVSRARRPRHGFMATPVRIRTIDEAA